MKEQYFKLFIGFALLLLIVACSTETEEELMREAPSSEFAIEHIEGTYIGTRFDEETFGANFDTFTPHPDNEYYAPRRNYDQYWNNDLLLSVDQSTKKVLQVSVLENSEVTLPAATIAVGSTIEEVKQAFGGNYYTYSDEEQDIHILGYVDHDRNLAISFLYNRANEIISYSLGYAFDRMKWESD